MLKEREKKGLATEVRETVSSEDDGSHNRLRAAEKRIRELKEITQNGKRVRRQDGKHERKVKRHGKQNEV